MEVPPLAFLPMMKKKYPNISDRWDPYLTYKPLKSDCSDEEVNEFFPEDVKCIVQCVRAMQNTMIKRIH